MPPPLTFLRAAETWVPHADGSRLVPAPHTFAASKRLEGLGRTAGFDRGEGLPGRAWDQGRPILMRELDASYFQRAAAAQEAGVTCAIAVPLFVSGALKAVLVLFCGHFPGRPGALELWHSDPDATGDMTLVEGAYGESSLAFEATSRETVLARGEGLPGIAWHRGETVFVEDLSASPKQFKRAEQAGDAGVRRGLAIPFGSRSEGGYVVALLAGTQLPLALAVERWEPDDARKKMLRTSSFSERQGGRSAAAAELALGEDGIDVKSAVGAAYSTGVPAISDDPASEPGPVAAVASAVGATALVAIPVVWGGSVIKGVVVLYL